MTPDFKGRTLLQIIPKLIGGGAEETTREVAAAFQAHGGKSLVVSSGGPMAATIEGEGSRHIMMPAASKNPLLVAQNARDLAALIKTENVSLVHARSRAPAWSALMAARRTERPFITTFHGHYSAKSRLKKLYNSVMVRSDEIIANSAFTAEHIRAEFAGARYFKEARLTTIPRGADLGHFRPDAVSSADLEAAKAQFGEGFRVLLPGRFTPWKGQEILLRAAHKLARGREDINLRLILIGRMDEKPEYVEHLRRLTEEFALAGQVQFLPATSNLAPLYRAADLVVSASTAPEAFGRIAVEAQAAGTPVAAAAHGGALETVLDQETGILVPPGDSRALADAIAKIHDLSPLEREAMGRRGTEHAQENYSMVAMTHATMIVYQRALERWQSGVGREGSEASAPRIDH